MSIIRPHVPARLTTLLAVTLGPPAFAQGQPAGEPDQPARLDAILAVALERHPELAEQSARLASAQARTAEAGRLPDLQLRLEPWGVPLRRPFAVREASAVMVGLVQSLPAPGTLAARTRVAAEESSAAAVSQGTRRRELIAQVRRSFADYYRADRELKLHREHVDLTGRLVQLARSSYRSGQRAQQDVLRLSLELSRLHRDLAHIEQERISARALLNTLMNRDIEAPLGPPAELDPIALPPLPPEEARKQEGRRPEWMAAQAALRKSEAALDLARSEGRWPSLTVGADYMYMPAMPGAHGYGAMLMVNLPWLNPGKRDAVRAAEHAVSAERRALESVRNLVRYELRDARARYDAARSTFTIVDEDLLPQAQRNYDAAYSGYAAGQGDAMVLVDALRSFLEVRLDRVRALVHLATAAADLARATGDGEVAR